MRDLYVFRNCTRDDVTVCRDGEQVLTLSRPEAEQIVNEIVNLMTLPAVLPHKETAPLTAHEQQPIDPDPLAEEVTLLRADLAEQTARLNQIRRLAAEMQSFALWDAEREYVQGYGRTLARLLRDGDQSEDGPA